MTRSFTVLHVVGARPNFMKIAPVLRAMHGRPGMRSILVHTGQHYDDAMSRAFFDDLGIPEADEHLGVGSGTHAVQTAGVMRGLEPVLERERPDLDWLVLLGASLPAATGAWALLLKPQVSAITIALWLKQGRAWVLIPITVLSLLILSGLYPLPGQPMPWSADVWPYGLPIGLLLGYKAFRTQDPLMALAAMPFLSPYLALQSWIFALLPLTRKHPGYLLAGLVVAWTGTILFMLKG